MSKKSKRLSHKSVQGWVKNGICFLHNIIGQIFDSINGVCVVSFSPSLKNLILHAEEEFWKTRKEKRGKLRQMFDSKAAKNWTDLWLYSIYIYITYIVHVSSYLATCRKLHGFNLHGSYMRIIPPNMWAAGVINVNFTCRLHVDSVSGLYMYLCVHNGALTSLGHMHWPKWPATVPAAASPSLRL